MAEIRIGKVNNVESIVRSVTPGVQEVRTLQNGNAVYAGEIISTSEEGSVIIELDNGEMLILGRNTQMRLDDDVYPINDMDLETEAAVDITALQQAILEGNFDSLEETAAGDLGALGAASEGGIHIARQASEGKVNVGGFDTVAHAQGINDVLTNRFANIEQDNDSNSLNNTLQINEDTSLTINAAERASGLRGSDFTIVITSQATNGTITINADGTITYTPNLNFNGKDSFSYVVTDGFNSSSAVTINLDVLAVNDEPVAQDDYANVNAGGAAVINALANDTDLDGDTLQIQSVTQGANGTVTINSDGTISYIPTAGFVGQDSFRYTITDGNGGFSIATITVTVDPVVNQIPTLTVESTKTVNEDGVTTITYSANDIDGTVVVNATALNGSVVVNANGTITYTPNPNFFGTDTITVTATDDDGATVVKTSTITVNSVNDAPILILQENAQVNSNSLVDTSGTATGTVTDLGAGYGDENVINGNTWQHGQTLDGTTANDTVNVANGDNKTVNAGDGNDYVVMAAGSGVSVDTGLGDDKVEITANGERLTINTGDGNDRVVTQNNFDGQWHHDSIINTGAGNDYVELMIGNNVRYSLGEGNDVIERVQATGANTGAFDNIIDGGAGDDTFIINGNFVDYKVIDNGDGTHTIGSIGYNASTWWFDGKFKATVTNVENIQFNDQTVAINTAGISTNSVDIAYSVSDIDGTVVSVVASVDPAHGTVVVNANNTITFTPAANYEGQAVITVVATDNNGAQTTKQSLITIGGNNTAPVIDPISTQAVAEDGTKVIAFNATDADLNVLTSSVTATNGVATIDANGDIVFTPTADFNGTATVTLSVSDGITTTIQTFDVIVSAVNDAPVIAPIATQTMAEDTIKTISFSATDADLDTLTPTVSATNGTAIIDGNGDIIFTPNANFNGTATVTLSISDGTTTTTQSFDINITAVNDVPVANIDSGVTTQDTNITLNLIANDTDADLDALTITAISSAANGTVVNNGDGTVTYTPNPGYSGADSFTYTISDGNGGTDTATVNITVGAALDNTASMPTLVVTLDAIDSYQTVDTAAHQDLGAGYGNQNSISVNSTTVTADLNDTITTTGGNYSVSSGAGDDKLVVGNGHNLTLDTGTGNDLVELNSDWGDNLTITTGDGDDRVVDTNQVAGSNHHGTNIDTGAGNDYVQVLKASAANQAESVTYNLGSGNDTIERTFDYTVQTQFQIIDGGDGNDTLILNEPEAAWLITDNGDGTFTFTPSHATYDFNTFTVTNIENVQFNDNTISLVAAPTITMNRYTMTLDAGLTDLDGSETLSNITLTSVPAGAIIKDSLGNIIAANGDGSYTITIDGNGDATITVESTAVISNAELTAITASVTSTESNGGATATQTAIISSGLPTSGDLSFVASLDNYAETIGTTATAGSVTDLGAGYGNQTSVTLGNWTGTTTHTTGADNDTINVGLGYTSIDSGDGDDNVVMSAGHNVNIVTGAGDDRVEMTGNYGSNNTISTGDGNDRIIDSSTGTRAPGMQIDTGAGHDFVDMAAGDNQVAILGSGNDEVIMGAGHNTIIDAGTGDDSVTVTGYGTALNINTGDGNDQIINASGTLDHSDSIIDTGAGDDTVQLLNGANIQYNLGAGNDIIENIWAYTENIDRGQFVDGGTGADTLILNGNSFDYNIKNNGDGTFTIQPVHTTHRYNDLTITNIENIQFLDKTVAIGTDGAAGVYEYAMTLNAGSSVGTDTFSSITLTNVPAGVTITGATDNGDGTFTVPVDANADASITLVSTAPLSSDELNAMVATITATSADASTQNISTSLNTSIDIGVAATAPIVTMSISQASVAAGEINTSHAARTQNQYGSENTIDSMIYADHDWHDRVVDGTTADDTINVLQGQRQIISSGDGDDLIMTSSGNSVALNLDTGAGDDLVVIASGKDRADDVINTGTGDDRVVLANDLDNKWADRMQIDTGAGDDYVEHSAGREQVISLGEGNDIYAKTSAELTNLGTIDYTEVVEGGSSADIIYDANGDRMLNSYNYIDGGNGVDTFVINGDSANYRVTARADGRYEIAETMGNAWDSGKFSVIIENFEHVQFNDTTINISPVPTEHYTYDITLHTELTDTDGSETLSDITLSAIPTHVVVLEGGANKLSPDTSGSYILTPNGSGNVTITLASYTPLTTDQLNAITASATSTETANGLTATTTVKAPAVYDEIAISDETGVINGNLLDNVEVGSTLDSIVYNGTTYAAADYPTGLTIPTLSGGSLVLDFTTGSYTYTGGGADENFTVNATDIQSNAVTFTFEANDFAVDGFLYGNDTVAEQFNIETGHDTTIVNFDFANDVLDLSEVITGPVDAGTLSNYLDFTFGATDTDGDGNMDVTAIKVDADGNAATTNDITTIHIQDSQFDVDQISDLKIDYQDN